MADINNITLYGRLAKDMEISYTKNGTPVGNVVIAVNRRRKVNDDMDRRR
ncbi:MAG: single-stranded DNA-binding protein [Planctomycetes bacterium]|nr:single-stranded DNA-binding protein [Planctomycetota bacterium]